MTTTFTFSKKNNNTNNPFRFNNSSSNYSKIIDNGILADLIKKNSYLFKTTQKKNEDADIFLANLGKTYSDDILKAANFLANYKKYYKKYTLPYTLGKMYTLTDGTPIVFYDDEIQIGFDSYSYSDLSDLSFIDALSAPTKKIIINIYTNSAANININLL